MSAITVVIPAFRNRDRVARTVQSVLDQANVAVRVVVVIDDQCTETRAILEAFGDRVDILFNDRTMGAPWCRNLGLAGAATRFVMFLDSDDYLEGPLLSGICRRMDASDAQIGIGQTIQEYEDGRPRAPLPMPGDRGAAMFENWCGEKAFSGTCSIVWDAAYLRAIGGWDESLKRSQDSELIMRALLKGARTCLSTEGAGIYVQHDGGHRITRSRDYSSSLQAASKLLSISSACIDRDVVERAIAARAFKIALLAFELNHATLAEDALALAHSLGLTTRPGRRVTRLLIALLGVRATIRLRSWIRRRPGVAVPPPSTRRPPVLAPVLGEAVS